MVAVNAEESDWNLRQIIFASVVSPIPIVVQSDVTQDNESAFGLDLLPLTERDDPLKLTMCITCHKIKEKALKLKEEKKLRKICPMVVFGDTANGEKEIYVAYMSEPSFPQFSKFMAASKKDEVIAMRTLARDCFVDGDKELVDDESLFLFGLMGQLSELITTRQSVLVNL